MLFRSEETVEESKEAVLGNGTVVQQSQADMDTIPGLEQISPDPSALSSHSCVSHPHAADRPSYYRADDRNGGGQSQWASDDIPEYLNTIRSEVAVSLAAPLPPAQSSEASKLQKPKRQSVGIWRCRGCGKNLAGGAWELTTAAALTAKATVHRLKKVKVVGAGRGKDEK